jgi:hypothetical protein
MGRRLQAFRTPLEIGILALALASPLQLAAAGEASKVATDAAALSGEAPAESADGPKHGRAARHLGSESTLADWKAAAPDERSKLAVAIAPKRLPADTPKLDIAKRAMEISGCLTKTAGDERFAKWTVEPTATTCLTAPEKEPSH